MAANGDWSDEENSILVMAYLDMLRRELRDEAFVKAEVNRQLQAELGRGRGSIEFKLANVSAVLREMTFPFINGYKPYPNIEASLRDRVREEILRDQDLTHRVPRRAIGCALQPSRPNRRSLHLGSDV